VQAERVAAALLLRPERRHLAAPAGPWVARPGSRKQGRRRLHRRSVAPRRPKGGHASTALR
jgi:hypothetical protein